MEVWGGNQVADSAVAVGGLDAWVYCRPFGEADGGGDVYYVSACATGRITRLLLADVTGHGAAVCDVAGQLRGLMRRYVNYLDQTAFVRSMNDQFVDLSDAGCFATAVVTTYFAPTGYLSVCNAGHPPPLVYRARERRWSFMAAREDPAAAPAPEAEPKNIPLGVLHLADYDQFEERLDVGDLVLCYTDSLIEARDAAGNLFLAEGLLDVVRRVDPSDPATFIPRLLSAVAARATGGLGADDVTVLLFRPNGAGRRVTLRQSVMAPVRLLGALARSLRRRGDPMPWPDFTLANVGGAVIGPLSRLWKGRGRTMKAER
jgi:serine phosphatase RsbU (regulator of sigma subunit)